MRSPQCPADEEAHVLYDAEGRHIHLLEHHHAFAHIVQRHFLRVVTVTAPESGTNWSGELGVARAGRQVDQQIIQFPQHIPEELLDRGVHHRSAPDDGGVFRDEKPIEISLTPWLSAGAILPSFSVLGVFSTPIIIGMLGP